MTLRDIGQWLSGVWDRILSDLTIVLTNYPLDWPIWFIVVLIFVVMPASLGFLGYALDDYRSSPQTPTIWSVIGSGFGAFATTLLVIDSYTSMVIIDYLDRGLLMLALTRMAYPFMAMMFIPYFILELRLWLHQRR